MRESGRVRLPSPNEIQREIENRPLEEELITYIKWVFKVVYAETFIENWHHKEICDVLMKVYRGELIHVIINIPPRYSKTEIVVKCFISWCLAKNPKCKFIHLSYSDELALDNSSQTKDIVRHEEFQNKWFTPLKKDSTSKKKWYTTHGGGVYATSMGGQITGFGAGSVDDDEFGGALIIDDPIKPADASSGVMRKKINASFNNTIKSRLNDPVKTPIIVIMQRLHEDDFSGYLEAGNTEFDWFVLRLPAINVDGPSEHDPRFEGQALWIRKHNEEVLEKMKEKSPTTFSGQYQQQPAPDEGNIIKKAWVKYYQEVPSVERKVQSWDFSFGGKDGKNKQADEKKKNDFVVGTLWGSSGSNHYILDMARDRLNLPLSIAAMKAFSKLHPDAIAKLVELKANGQGIVDSVSGEISGIIGIIPTASKESRLIAVSPLFEAGNIWLPDPAYFPQHKWWVTILVAELCSFPYAKHDDTVDSCSQYLNKYGIIVADDFSSDYDNASSMIASGSKW